MLKRLAHRLMSIAAVSALLLQTGCSAHSFFYYPNRMMYVDPASIGLKYELLAYPSLNGKKLYAILFQTDQTPKGTVVHFHGNFGNVSNHFAQSYFLTRYGFDVLAFDYEGFGGSEGRPTPKRTVEDGIATVRYAHAHLRNPDGGVVVFGQSLGAAVAAVVAAKEPLVKGVVLEAGFATYRSMARAVLARSALTWILWPVFPLFLGSTYDPIRYVGKISPRPVFVIQGDKDTVVPVAMARKIYDRANEPKKLKIVAGADHLLCRRVGGKAYEQELADFFTAALAAKNNN